MDEPTKNIFIWSRGYTIENSFSDDISDELKEFCKYKGFEQDGLEGNSTIQKYEWFELKSGFFWISTYTDSAKETDCYLRKVRIERMPANAKTPSRLINSLTKKGFQPEVQNNFSCFSLPLGNKASP
jgi:hypothetical protein